MSQVTPPPWFSHLKAKHSQYKRALTGGNTISQMMVDAVRDILQLEKGEMFVYNRLHLEAAKMVKEVKSSFKEEVTHRAQAEGLNPRPILMMKPVRKTWSTDTVHSAIWVASLIQVGRLAGGEAPLCKDDLLMAVEERLEAEGLRGGQTSEVLFITPPEEVASEGSDPEELL